MAGVAEKSPPEPDVRPTFLLPTATTIELAPTKRTGLVMPWAVFTVLLFGPAATVSTLR